MKILVTGAKGFIGKNLITNLKNSKDYEIYEYDINNTKEELEMYTKDCEFVFHLAGVNRPENPEEFMKGNFGFTSTLLDSLKANNNKCTVLITSSIKAIEESDYGKSKKAGEDLMIEYEKETGSEVYIYRLPNVFGKWCRPNYNSAVSTFCNNIANDLDINVNDPKIEMHLVYINDIVVEFIKALEGKANKKEKYCKIETTYKITLGEIVDLIYSFKESRKTLLILNMKDGLTKKLYSTYLSYLPEDKFKYDLKMNIDERGSFTEMFKTLERGQVSVNISKPGIIKGNHYHHTKTEKFIVVSGNGIIRFRKVDTEKIIEYKVSGEKIEVIDIPVGYIHNIENIGNTDMVTIMWVNEIFDKENPDTYFMEV